MIGNRLIDADAKARGVDRDASCSRKSRRRSTQPTDGDVAEWYKSNQQRVQGATARAGRGADSIAARPGAHRGGPAHLRRPAEGVDAVAVTLDPPRVDRLRRGPAVEGTGECAGADHRVLGLRVPVLFPRQPDGGAGPEHLRRSRAPRLPAPAAPQPSERPPGRRGLGVRQRAGPILGIPRPPVREPIRLAAADLKQHAADLGPRHRRSSTRASIRAGSRRTSTQTSTRLSCSACRARPTSSSTAGR